jgi:dihydrofolate synthase/folylpolyglutamate synthase
MIYNFFMQKWGIFMTYEEAREFIRNSNQYGIVPGLETITELLRRLGNPQEKLKVIHVAGTNGKGSVSALITSILCEAGYRVGRYLSPAVFTYREIIQVAEKRIEYITVEGICDAIAKIKPACEDMVKEGFAHPTSFEIETAMAMLYLLSEQVDFAVIEVGLGGRLDATNVIKHPVCSIITSISMDHMKILGDTLEKIAAEKAGIIKEGSPAVTCRQEPGVLKVLEETCKGKNTKLVVSDFDKAAKVRFTPEETSFSIVSEKKEDIYRIRLLGEYQVDNAVLAVKAAEVIDKLGYPISDEAVKNGLFNAKWSGRFEVIARDPYLVIDGAHNEDAALVLKKSIQLYFTNRRIIYMIGVLADKDYKKILKITAPLADVIITLTPNNNRALSSDALAKEARAFHNRVMDAGNMKEALRLAYKEAGVNDVIIAFGSLSFLGDLVSTLGIRKDDVTYDR